MALPEEPLNFQFPQACVLWTNEQSAPEGRRFPKLFVQVIDSYSYQREWTLALVRKDGAFVWESHIYRHPGRRFIVEVTKAKAEKLIAEFLLMCKEHPNLLFNEAGYVGDGHGRHLRPRADGFVHFAERLHDGADPSVKLLG